MNPASVMKLVTTYAALDLLGSGYRWKTEAFLGGKLDKAGTLVGDLILKGYGDPKITIEQWQAFMADLRTRGLKTVTGDLVLDRSFFKLPEHDPAAFDHEPLKPYNVGPDALLVNFKAVRFAFAPDAAHNAVGVRFDPRLPDVAVAAIPQLAGGDCGDWRETHRRQLHESRRERVGGVRRPLSAGVRRTRLVRGAARSRALRPRHVHHLLHGSGRQVRQAA